MAISGRSLSPPCRVDLDSAPGVGTDSTLRGGEIALLHIGGGAAIRHGGHFEARCVRIWPIWDATMALRTATAPLSHSCERREALESTAPDERFQPRSVSLRGVRRLILSHSRRAVSVS